MRSSVGHSGVSALTMMRGILPLELSDSAFLAVLGQCQHDARRGFLTFVDRGERLFARFPLRREVPLAVAGGLDPDDDLDLLAGAGDELHGVRARIDTRWAFELDRDALPELLAAHGDCCRDGDGLRGFCRRVAVRG